VRSYVRTATADGRLVEVASPGRASHLNESG
jgi:hypothetical protein